MILRCERVMAGCPASARLPGFKYARSQGLLLYSRGLIIYYLFIYYLLLEMSALERRGRERVGQRRGGQRAAGPPSGRHLDVSRCPRRRRTTRTMSEAVMCEGGGRVVPPDGEGCDWRWTAGCPAGRRVLGLYMPTARASRPYTMRI